MASNMIPGPEGSTTSTPPVATACADASLTGLSIEREQDPTRLHDAVESIDKMSQDGFKRIRGLAALCLVALEGIDANQRISHIAHGLRSIASTADESMNGINCAAEDVGCNYKSEVAHG